MAKIKTESNEIEVEDGSSIQEACEQLGIPFACKSGNCGTCEAEVVEGIENLTEKTEEEKAWPLQDNSRLMCQCKIKQGEVKIKF